MKLQAGQTVVLTGASGGLGVFMAREFFNSGHRLALVAYPGTGLDDLRLEAEQQGTRAMALAYDLRMPARRHEVVERVRKELGPIDILVNNAGVECTSAYHELSEEMIGDVLAVNLEAPMMLSRLVLPEMVQRRRGHIVNISSLAGLSGPAFQEPYAATKAGLLAFTASLRASYRSLGVSASVVIPGFVEAGIYAHLKQVAGCAAPALLGTSSPGKVAGAVRRAIEQDLPEIIVNPVPVRPLLAFSALFPRIGQWLSARTGANEFFKTVVEAQKRSAAK
jgi:short-subunit dehydrogenase